MEILEIGPGPSEENVAQLGGEDFTRKNIAECKAFKAQIVRAYGEPPDGASLRTLGNPHDLGMYREVAVRVEDCESVKQAEAALDYAYKIEGDPDGHLVRWDAQARAELGLPTEVPA